MHASTTPQRDTYWDTIKALLIFLVVLGHAVQHFMYMAKDSMDFWSDPVFKGIYIFHMPLFMLISGFFAAKSISKHGRASVLRYLQRLALPCVGMGLIFLVLTPPNESFFRSFYDGCRFLWFLIVVFECVIFYLIMQLGRSTWYKAAMFIFPIPFAIFYKNAPDVLQFFPHKYQFTYLWPFFVLGTSLSHLKFTPQQIDKKWLIFPILYIAAYYLFQPGWYVYRCPLTFDVNNILVDTYRTLAAICGCGTAMWAGKYIHPFIGKYSIIQNIGRATLAIYVLQTLFFLQYKLIASYFPQSPGYIGNIILSCIILAALYLIYITTRRIPIAGALLYGEIKRK